MSTSYRHLLRILPSTRARAVGVFTFVIIASISVAPLSTNALAKALPNAPMAPPSIAPNKVLKTRNASKNEGKRIDSAPSLRPGRAPLNHSGKTNTPSLRDQTPIIAFVEPILAQRFEDITPRHKPGIGAPANKDQQTVSHHERNRMDTIRLGETRGSVPFSLPPFFFENDIKREVTSPPAHLVYTSDLPNHPVEVIVELQRGEALVDMLGRLEINADDRNEIVNSLSKKVSLRRLRAGQQFRIVYSQDYRTVFQTVSSAPLKKRLLSLSLLSNIKENVSLARVIPAENGRVFDTQQATGQTTERIVTISGKIDGSLFGSAKALGAPDDAIAELANIFAYDIDFQRDIFRGDSFEAIFKGQYDKNGKLVSGGEILFGKLTWRGGARGKNYYRFESATNGSRADYFDAQGQSAKRLLMKTPIDGARLSSGFGMRRHPIKGYRKAHKGVDFAARRGTPIYAAGDGTIERINRFGSFGNYIRIRHARGYKTAYAHLNGFKRGLRSGSRVRQGDVIGYVGSTGRSTGPHLHYEVHYKGKAVNPQKLKMATGIKLTGKERQRFRALRNDIDALRGVDEPQRTAAR
ncbi:MAG: peptidoglycan DD-metalloendopeptidase family protein [Pseudomonadota bacterium]